MISRVKNLFLALATHLMVLTLFLLSPLLPAQSLVMSSATGIDARPAQYQTVKAFSQTFCEVIKTGLSKESALKIASRELYKAILNRSLWSNIVLLDNGILKAYTTQEIIELTSSSINKVCGKELSIEANRGNINTKEYLESKIEEYFHEI